MDNKKTNKKSNAKNSIHSQSQVKYSSFREQLFNQTFERVKYSVDFEGFEESERDSAEELCLIIAEIFNLPPDTPIRIGGNDIPVEIVQVVYSRLAHEHIELVMSNFGRATYEIRHKKTYLRTALYNSVFEISAHYENLFKKNQPQYAENSFGARKGEPK